MQGKQMGKQALLTSYHHHPMSSSANSLAQPAQPSAKQAQVTSPSPSQTNVSVPMPSLSVPAPKGEDMSSIFDVLNIFCK
jgi:hypothetical protein